MPDIAKLARVKRAVVSMWRTRSASTDTPFPAPAVKENGREFFNVNEVGLWLAETGRGKNPEAEADASGFAQLPQSTRPGSGNFAVVTALLVLRLAIGRSLSAMRANELLDAADTCDPDDAIVFREIQLAASELEPLASFVDELVEGAYSEAVAFERLIAGRFALGQRHLAATTLTPAGIELMSQAITDLALTMGAAVKIVDVTGSSTDALIAIGTNERIQGDISFALGRDDTEIARLNRRRFRVHGIDHETVEIEPDGAFETAGAVVHVAQFPSAYQPSMSPAETLSAIDQIAIQMDATQVALIMAPSSILSDGGLDQEANSLRERLLRSGSVRAIVRLPKGLRPSTPRQTQALWLMGPAQDGSNIADRVTFVSNLEAVSLDATVIARLVHDLLAAANDGPTLRGQSFWLGQLRLTRFLLAGDDSLVTGSGGPQRTGASDPESQSSRIENLRTQLLKPVERAPLDLPHAAIALAGIAKPARSVRQLINSKSMRYLPGTRLQSGDIHDSVHGESNVRVVGPLEVLGDLPIGARVIESLVLSYYASHRVTKPGDIVFCTSPRPTAVIDAEGGAVVEYPARILRIDSSDPDGLLSETVCVDINALSPTDKNWQAWHLRRVEEGQRAALAGALDALRAEQSQARDRIGQLEEMAALFIDVTAEGSLILKPVSDLSTLPEGTI